MLITLNILHMSNYQTLLYYKFVQVEQPEAIMKAQKVLCENLELKGRILISKEGVNGTVEGTIENTEKYIEKIKLHSEFADIVFKKSLSNGSNFPKLSIKARDEIVTTGLPYNEELGPLTGLTGKYITAEELHDLYRSDEEFYIIDMRNDYEFKVGHFKNSIIPKALKNFRDIPNIIPEIEHLKDKKIITVCTGGIRCEKASGFLMYNGFKNVYQLKDGIVTYMEKYPNEDFLGKLYVFDNRLMMGFNTESPDHVIVGKCDYCGVQSERIIDYKNPSNERFHGVVCAKCMEKENLILD
ncbi:MAG: rhodanese-related sulfurtransferase [Patescibacteria group bacterium]